ncbi:MAG: hypothetical protein V1676_00960 [Candidatus Diapherotrites archaeon]
MARQTAEAVVAGCAVLFLAVLLFEPVRGLAEGVSKFFFEGTAEGRVLLFLAWAVLLFCAAFALGRMRLRVKMPKHTATAIALLLVLCWFMQVQFQGWLVGAEGLPPDATAAVLGSDRGTLGWEATQLMHIHITKGLLYPALSLLPSGGFDTGAQMYGLLPFWFGIAFLAAALLLFIFLMLEFLSAECGTQGRLLFSVFSFCALVSIFDGGPFTIVGRIALALMVAYFLFARKGVSDYRLFVMPYFAVGGALYIGSFFLRSSSFLFGSYEFLGIGMLLSPLLALNARNIFGRVFWACVFVLLVLWSLNHFMQFGLGSEFYAGEEARVLIYGVPEGAAEQQLLAALSSFGSVANAEMHGYVAFASLIPTHDFRASELERKLRAELNPRSYMHVLKSWQRGEGVLSGDGVETLADVKSEYVSFRKETVNGATAVVASGYFPHPYLSLYALSVMHSQGVSKPVVFSTVK